MNFVQTYWHRKVNAAVKQFYIETLGHTEQEWQTKVANNHRSFNLVWRSALRRLIPDLELNDQPPPDKFRKIYLFPSSADQTESATN